VNQIIEANTFEGLFTLYKSKEFRRMQQESRPSQERANNFRLKFFLIDWWRRRRATVTVRDMTPLLNRISTSDRVVDLLCGQEDILEKTMMHIWEKNPRAIAIGIDNQTDVSSRILRKNIAFCRGDATKTDIPDHSVDLVLICYGLQVLGSAHRDDLFKEVRRILAPGGSAIFMEVLKLKDEKKNEKNRKEHNFWNSNAPYFILEDNAWVKYIEENGFRVETSTYVIDRSKAYLAHPL